MISKKQVQSPKSNVESQNESFAETEILPEQCESVTMGMLRWTRLILPILLIFAVTSPVHGFLFRINYTYPGKKSRTTMASTSSSMEWTPLKPSAFPTCKVDNRQIAKDEDYLGAVQEVWKVSESDIPVEKAPFVYFDSSNTPLYGHMVRRSNTPTSESSTVPGILLFHTGAGPQDIFLFYKAYELAQEFDSVILICDILSDETGWAWGSDRTKYNKVSQSLLEDKWALMGSRSLAAAEALCAKVPRVDSHRIAAIGWCLGGKPILELGLSPVTAFTIIAMISFHGVYGRDDQAWKNSSEKDKNIKGQAEICAFNGADDPFVSQVHLDTAKKRLEAIGHTFKIFQMAEAKHGFSNPAQAWNDNPAFSYTESAAKKGWEETIALLHRRLGASKE
jgi:dienelactone hydrolase